MDAMGWIQTILVSVLVPLFSAGAAWLAVKKRYELEDRAVRVVHRMLKPRKPKKWKLRSFKLIRHHIGGFTDNQLRQILVRAGAVRFRHKDTSAELWGLLEINQARLGFAGIETTLDPANLPDEQLFRYEADPSVQTAAVAVGASTGKP
jgi:hypothetical protein